MYAPRRTSLIPLLGLALLALLAGLWAGLLRLGGPLPLLTSSLALAHGALMVSGFLGTLIPLERAVALRRGWMYFGPLLTGVGAALTFIIHTVAVGPALLTMGSLVGVFILIEIARAEPALHSITMLIGALAWFAGNVLWLLGWPVFRVVFLWQAFLVLTIAGERLELSRVLRPSRLQHLLFGGIIALLLAGTVLALFNIQIGVRVEGAALLLLALWSRRNDLAWRNLRHRLPLTRYIAYCLVLALLWLGAARVLALIFGIEPAGPHYDAVLHAIFLGFVISMIFGHAPIILPAILGVPISFKAGWYLPLLLLHVSLALRVLADYLSLVSLRMWGGLLSEVAILWFLIATAFSIQQGLSRTHGAPGAQGLSRACRRSSSLCTFMRRLRGTTPQIQAPPAGFEPTTY
jgi:hypothetical protein